MTLRSVISCSIKLVSQIPLELFLSYYTLSHTNQNLAADPLPLAHDKIVWGSRNCPPHYTVYLVSAGADLLLPVLGPNKSSSGVRKGNHTLTLTPLGPDANYHIFVLPAYFTKS